MSVFKVTFAFNSGITGWSENYYTEAGTPNAAIGVSRALAIVRIKLCGEGVNLPHIRVSELSVRGDSIIDQQPGFTTVTGGFGSLIQVKPASLALPADVSWTAVLVSFTKANYVIGRVYMRGVADEFFTNDRVFAPTQAWKKAFADYAAELANPAEGWGFYRSAPSVPGNTFAIRGAAAAANTDIVLDVAPGFPAIAGDIVRVTGLKSNLGTLRGNFAVTNVAGNFYTLAKQFPAASLPIFTSNTGKIRIYAPNFVFTPAASFSYFATERKAGRPFGSPVGRRKKAKLLP